MEPLLVLLLIPALGLVMLYFRHQLVAGMEKEDRRFARWMLGVLGGLSLVHGVGYGVWSAVRIFEHFDDSGSVLIFIARLAASGILVFAGSAALRVSRHELRRDLPLSTETQYAHDREALLLGIIGLVGLPLIVPGSMVLMVLWGFAGVEYALHALVDRGRQNRLLWTMTLAARHQRSMADEIEQLAHSESRAQRARLEGLVRSLRNGSTLSRSLMTDSRLLPLEMAAAIQAGEQSGHLADVLRDLAVRHTESVRTFQWDNSLNAVSAYVTLMCSVILFLAGFIMYFIMPKYKQIFLDFGAELPRSTMHLINASDSFAAYWYLIIPLASLPFMLIFQVLYLTVGQARWVPANVRAFWPRLATPMILRSLSAAAKQDMSLVPTLVSLGDTHMSSQSGPRYHRAAQRLTQGDTLGDSLLAEGLLTRREATAVERAAELGHLPWALYAIATQIEQLRLRRMETLVEWLKPITILAIGAVVLSFCIALFYPVVKLLLDLS